MTVSTVVIPCFNRATTVGEAIESARRQGADVDVIVIDDGSSDHSWDVIVSYGEAIQAHRTVNRGVARARNSGIRASRGAWLKFLDSDDVMLDGSLDMQLRQARTCGARAIPVGQLSKSSEIPVCQSDLVGRKITDFELSSRSLQVSQALFPREAILEVGGFGDSSIQEDYEMVIRLRLRGWDFYIFDTPVLWFRDDDGRHRLSSDLTAERFSEAAEVFQRILNDEKYSTATLELRLGLGRCAWSMARRAAREDHQAAANRLFSIAESFSGQDARKGSFLAGVLYLLFDPFRTEKILSRVKELVRA